MVSYQKMKEQTIKQQVPVVEPKVQQDQINKPAAVPSLKEKPEITLYIKPARKTAKYFINYFPPKLYCSPYKYDLMIRLPVEVNDQYDLIFTLIDSETKERITKNTKGEEAYCIERTKTQRKNYLKPGFINATFRLNFSICSFHNFRRPFQISIHLRFKALSKNINNTGGDYNDDQLVYMSEAFSIFARKSGGKDKQANNDDDWGQLSPIGNNTNTTTTTSTTVTEVANEQKGTKENGEKRKRTKATDFTSKSATTTTEKKKRKKEKQSKPREEPVNNENKQISVSLEDELQLSIQNSPKSSPLPTTNIKLEIEQNSTDFSSFFENDFSQVLTPNSSHSIPSFDVNNSVQLEELNMINQPQQSLMHIPPQQTNNNCFNYSTPIVPQQQNVDLSMLVYQELLNQQQFNQQQQTANLIKKLLEVNNNKFFNVVTCPNNIECKRKNKNIYNHNQLVDLERKGVIHKTSL
ncbi:hypothetical protein ABK040_005513 [Willaertia magna]